LIAPASLKHAACPTGTSSFFAVFRGLIAPASLKHFVFVKLFGSNKVFRGLIAPASLKRGDVDFLVFRDILFSGA